MATQLRSEAASRPAARRVQAHPVVSLLGQLCLREITETIKGSALGLLWLALGPLMSMLLYVIVFGVLFGGSFGMGARETPLHFALGVYIGLSVVNLINDAIGRSPHLIPGKANFVKRIIFPLPLLPVVQVCGTAFTWMVNITLALLLAAGLQALHWSALLWLPVIYLPLFLMGLGLAWTLSALSVYFRDIQQVVPILTQVVFWSSGVFYGASRVMEYPPLWAVLKWNPVLLAIENTRHAVLWQLPVDAHQLLYIWAVGLATALAGWALFMRLKAGFAELL